MSTLDLEPIKERRDKAHTEWGPWKAKGDSWDGYSVVIDDNGPGVSIIAEQIGQGEDEGRGDAEFIAHAPEDIAELIAALERQSELNMGLEAEVHAQRQKLEAVKEAIAKHPDVMECSEYSDDEPVSCGWKRAYEDVVWALNGGKE